MPLAEEDIMDWVQDLGLLTDMMEGGRKEAEDNVVYSKTMILYMEAAEIQMSSRSPSGW